MFEQPKLADEPEDFELRIIHNKVSLSHCTFAGGILTGVVVVAKMNYSVKLTVRYTTDEWASYCDTTAHYIGMKMRAQIDSPSTSTWRRQPPFTLPSVTVSILLSIGIIMIERTIL